MKKISDIIAEEKPQKINQTRTQIEQRPPDIKDIERNPKNIKLYKLELDGKSPIVVEEVNGELTIRLSDEAKHVLEKGDFVQKD